MGCALPAAGRAPLPGAADEDALLWRPMPGPAAAGEPATRLGMRDPPGGLLALVGVPHAACDTAAGLVPALAGTAAAAVAGAPLPLLRFLAAASGVTGALKGATRMLAGVATAETGAEAGVDP